MPGRYRSGGLSKGNLHDTNVKATSIDEDIFSDQESISEAADGDLILVLDVSETPDKVKYITKTNLIGAGTVSITNNTDNYVLTGTGTAVNGEANLQFDGTILTVESGEVNIDKSSGDPHLSFQIGDTDKFTIGVDDSDSDKFKIDTGGTVGGATKFTLDSSGNVTIAGDLTVSGSSTASVATTVTITDNESTNEDNAIVFTSGGDVDGGNLGLESDGNLIYNPSTGRLTATQLAGTLQTAAQTNITSLGTLSALNIDNVAIDGATIGHSSDTDLITLADGNVTIAGELDLTTLDVSGNVDVDGVLEADSITVNGTALDEFIADTVGAMVNSNTESGITVAYQDGDNTLDFTVGTLNQDTTGNADTATLATNITASANNSTDETVYPTFVDGATGTQGLETDTGLTYNPSTGVLTTTSVTGNLTGNVTGNVSGTAATVTGAAQSAITSLGTLTALTVDDVAVDGKVITMTGSSSDTAVFTAGTNGTLTIETTDAAAAAANIQITADGTFEVDATSITLDSAGDIVLDADDADVVFKDGGTTIGTFTNSSSDFVMTAGVQDKDIIFKGDDGGSGITALTLDMSDAGKASFNGAINIGSVSNAGEDTDKFLVLDSSGNVDFRTGSEVASDIGAGSGSVSLTGSTNNTITTVTGSNAIAGEATFTYDGSDLKITEAVNDGNPSFQLGSADAESAKIQAVYDSGAQTLNYLEISTATADTGGDAGKIIFDVDGTDIATIDDGGIDLASGLNFTINGSAISTDNTMGDGFVIEDDDGTEVTLTENKEMKIIGSGVTTNWTDTSTGSDGDPYDLTITVDAAQTGITSLLATDIKIGEDDQTKIDFETADTINFYAGNENQLVLTDGYLTPSSNGIVDLGTDALEFNNAFFDGTVEADSITIAGTALNEYIADTVGDMVGSNTETGIAVTYEDGDNTLDFVLGASQTTITSIYNASLKMGRDADNLIDFATTDNKIILRVNGVNEIELVENALSPVTSDGVALGTTSLMWSDLFLASGSVINFNNGDVTLTHSSNTLTVAGGTLATAALTASTGTFSGILKTDDTTDATSTTDGSLQTDGGLSVAKDVVIGNDVKLLSDSAVFNMGADNDFTITHDGTTGATIAGNPLILDSGGDITLDADGADVIFKDGSATTITVTNSSNDAVFTVGTQDKDFIVKGDDGGSAITALTLDMSNAGAATFNSAITGGGLLTTGGNIVIPDDGNIGSASDTDSIAIAANGNVTVSQSLTVSGNLTVTGTTTQVDTVTMNASNAVVFEGATADAHESTLTIVDPTADRTIYLPNQSGYLPVLAAVSTTQVSSTPEELNILDGVTASTSELNIMDGVTATTAEINLIDGGTARGTTAVASGDGILINDGGTMRMTNVDTVSTYFASHSVGGSNIVTTGALDSGSITSGFGAIDNGTSGIRTATFTAETAFVPDAADGATLGTASLEFSDLYLADGGVIYFGNDQEITLTHSADDGLILKHVGTGDGKEPSLTFQAGDNDIAADDVLGSIFFQAPDEGAGTDAILVAAGIEAVSEGDFSASSNATKLSFKTGSSEAAAEKVAISSAGNLSLTASNTELRFYEGSNYVGFEAPALSGDQIWVLPTGDGSNGQFIKTDGSGTLSFADAGGSFVGIKAYLNADLSISNNSATTLGDSNGSWTEVHDVGTIHDASTNPDRFTFGTSGYFLVTIQQEWAADSAGYREMKVTHTDTSNSNATNEILRDRILSTSNQATAISGGSTIFYADDGDDYLTVQLYQNSGAALNAEGGNDDSTFISISRLDLASSTGTTTGQSAGRVQIADGSGGFTSDSDLTFSTDTLTATKLSTTDISGSTITLDSAGDITLDAGGADLIFADDGTNLLKITNSSSDVVFQPQVDAKDIIFNQYDGNKIFSIDDGGFVGIHNSAAGPGEIRIYEDTDLGSHYTGFKAGNATASVSYVLPTADGNADDALTTNGSGTLSWAAAGGGITVADQWRLTATIDSTSADITSNLERIDDTGTGGMGSAMTQSSGIFTFPSTGYWLVRFIGDFDSVANDTTAQVNIQLTQNNSSYDTIANAATGTKNAARQTATCEVIVDVDDTANDKVKFATSSLSGDLLGATDNNLTTFMFIRLGDT